MDIKTIKDKYIRNQSVTINGNKYKIQDIVYWIDRGNNSWKTSVDLLDLKNQNSLVRVRIEDVEC